MSADTGFRPISILRPIDTRNNGYRQRVIDLINLMLHPVAGIDLNEGWEVMYQITGVSKKGFFNRKREVAAPVIYASKTLAELAGTWCIMHRKIKVEPVVVRTHLNQHSATPWNTVVMDKECKLYQAVTVPELDVKMALTLVEASMVTIDDLELTKQVVERHHLMSVIRILRDGHVIELEDSRPVPLKVALAWLMSNGHDHIHTTVGTGQKQYRIIRTDEVIASDEAARFTEVRLETSFEQHTGKDYEIKIYALERLLGSTITKKV